MMASTARPPTTPPAIAPAGGFVVADVGLGPELMLGLLLEDVDVEEVVDVVAYMFDAEAEIAPVYNTGDGELVWPE